jgi:hypothetical protein
MRIYCTTCSKEKTIDPEPIKAIDRYQSDRIKMVFEKAQIEGVDFRILSGKFGLLHANTPIVWYDQKLEMEAVPLLSTVVKEQLVADEITAIELFAKNPLEDKEWLPYTTLVEQVCLELKLEFTLHYL